MGNLFEKPPADPRVLQYEVLNGGFRFLMWEIWAVRGVGCWRARRVLARFFQLVGGGAGSRAVEGLGARVLWSGEVSGEVMFGLDLVGVIDCCCRWGVPEQDRHKKL